MGLLTTDLKYDVVRTQFQVSPDFDYERLNAEFASMRAALSAQFAADGIEVRGVSFTRQADARYVGQGYELRVGIPEGVLTHSTFAKTLAEFHAVHAREYGHAFHDSPVELVNIRLTGVAPVPKIGRYRAPSSRSLKEALVKKDKTVFRYRDRLQPLETSFYRRDLLPADARINGPAVVLQTDSTTVVPPACTLINHDSGNMILRLGASR
jgi:N-methylhydantoinase A